MVDLQLETASFSQLPRLGRSIFVFLLAMVVACGSASEKNDEIPPEFKDTAVTRSSEAPPKTKQERTEIIGGGHFVSIYAESFDVASIEKKNLVGQLCQAAAVADDLSYAAKGEEVVLLRGMLSGIQKARKHIPAQLREKLGPYTATFWLSLGPEDAWTKERIKAAFIPGELVAAAHTAMEKGYPLGVDSRNMGDLESNRLEQLEAMLAQVRPLLFGEKKGEPESVKKDDSAPTNTENSSGDSASPSDKPAEPREGRALQKEVLAEMAAQLTPARQLSDATDRKLLERAARAVVEGTKPAIRTYQSAVVQGDPEVVLWLDCIDSRERGKEKCRHGFGALVGIRDRKVQTIFHRVSASADVIEAALPFRKKWKNDGFGQANPEVLVYEAVCGAGALGAAVPVELTRNAGPFVALGKKEVLLSNLGQAMARKDGSLELRRAVLGRKSADLWESCAITNSALRLAVEQIHVPRSGKMDRGRKGPPARYLKNHAAVWEELRSELIGAFVASSPLARQILPGAEPQCAKEVYDDLIVRPVLDALWEKPAGGDDSLRAHRIIANWLISESLVGPVDGVWGVPSGQAFAEGLARLLGYVQKVRSLGMYREAQTFLEQHDRSVADTLLARARPQRVVERLIAIYPLLERSSDSERKNEITQSVMKDYFTRQRRHELQRSAF